MKKITPFKPYPKLNVTLQVQSYGTTFLMILRGEEADIHSVFNGLYNFGATSRGSQRSPIEPEFTDHNRNVATFWSSPRKMLRYFDNRFYFRHIDKIEKRNVGKRREFNNWKRIKGGDKDFAEVKKNWTAKQLRMLQKYSAVTFNPHKKSVYVSTHGEGIVSAEKPDNDFKDSVLEHAFANRENSQD